MFFFRIHTSWRKIGVGISLVSLLCVGCYNSEKQLSLDLPNYSSNSDEYVYPEVTVRCISKNVTNVGRNMYIHLVAKAYNWSDEKVESVSGTFNLENLYGDTLLSVYINKRDLNIDPNCYKKIYIDVKYRDVLYNHRTVVSLNLTDLVQSWTEQQF